MSGYKHIVVAIQLNDDARYLVEKAVQRAEIDKAKLTIIHIDQLINHNYTGMVGIDTSKVEQEIAKEDEVLLERIVANIDYPMEEHKVVCGDMPGALIEAAQEVEADLIIAGHHHDFWSMLSSHAKQLVNRSQCDLLIVPLN